jgi:hypothetical protein
VTSRNGRKPPAPKPRNTSRKPPAPPPHSNNGRMCRLGQAVGALILLYLAAVPLALVFS